MSKLIQQAERLLNQQNSAATNFSKVCLCISQQNQHGNRENSIDKTEGQHISTTPVFQSMQQAHIVQHITPPID